MLLEFPSSSSSPPSSSPPAYYAIVIFVDTKEVVRYCSYNLLYSVVEDLSVCVCVCVWGGGGTPSES